MLELDQAFDWEMRSYSPSDNNPPPKKRLTPKEIPMLLDLALAFKTLFARTVTEETCATSSARLQSYLCLY